MKIGTTHLFVPGPTTVPEVVRRAMNVPMEDHRAPDFPDFVLDLLGDLSRVLRLREGRVLLYPGSGTGAWEAAISNCLSRGDRVLMSRYGHFSTLWADMAQRLGLDVVLHDVEWGEGVPVEAYEQALRADPSIRAVFVTHNETATGVTSDVRAVRSAMDAAGSDALLFVDGVSSIASIEFRQDDWGVDVAVAGSQKGFMLPAGLAILGVSEKALAAAERTTTERCYFAFRDMIAANDVGYFPYTPPTPLLHGLRASLDRLLDEGMDEVAARHHRLGEGVRQGVKAWGLDLCALSPRWYSDTVTAVRVPAGVDGAAVCRIAYHRYRTSFGGGLGKVAGKVFRIGHLGDVNEVSCLSALAAAEMALLDAGVPLEAGSGVAAAQQYYRQALVAGEESAAEPWARTRLTAVR
ncbi:pyridoxal-phosphate-dependent aminotransferase family protein [Actinomycetospora aeridis]|uniref:Aminotransferase class V-fold PLP-dependent enzyme n=1 Tax=Actinomycetospora aeridis TaxID=3129231 RepID=A0ABU8NAD2_9PSEU